MDGTKINLTNQCTLIFLTVAHFNKHSMAFDKFSLSYSISSKKCLFHLSL